MNKDFLAITDFSTEEIHDVFRLAKELKEKTKNDEEHHILKGQTLAMIFQKPSARTRVSFEVGMFQLGGHALYLAPADIGLGKRESVADIARVLARYNDGIMARVFGHDDVEELGTYASVPVINGLSDLVHPCQIMADMLTVSEHLGRVENVKVVYIGDGNNVANSWINIAARLPFCLHLALPEGYDANSTLIKNAKSEGLSEIVIERDPKEAVKNADIIYTDVWASMGQEEEAAARKKIFKPFQVNEALVSLAKKSVKVMHCLPAHRGDEITDGVMDGPHAIVFDEAENRMHVQKAIMVKLMKKA